MPEAGGCLWFPIGMPRCGVIAERPGMTRALSEMESHLKKGEKSFLHPLFPAERRGSGIAGLIHENHSDLSY